MAGVGQDRAVLHEVEVLGADYLLVAGYGDEHVGDFGRVFHRHDPETFHRRLQRANRIDFGHDHVGAHAVRARSHAASAPSVTRHHDHRTAEQDSGGAYDRLDRRLAGAVAVVEQMLGLGVVDRNHRDLERAVFFHRAQPNHAGGGFLHAGDYFLRLARVLGMQQTDQVGAVVHRDAADGCRARSADGCNRCRDPRRESRSRRFPHA